ncbi:MAG: hypothetical protein ACI86M_003954 [Saprospiraceae bacterium]|jgi:hypothetical protein
MYDIQVLHHQNCLLLESDTSYMYVKHAEGWVPSIIPNQGGYQILMKDSKNRVVAYDILKR